MSSMGRLRLEVTDSHFPMTIKFSAMLVFGLNKFMSRTELHGALAVPGTQGVF